MVERATRMPIKKGNTNRNWKRNWNWNSRRVCECVCVDCLTLDEKVERDRVCVSFADFPCSKFPPDEGHQKPRHLSIQLTWQYEESKLHNNSKSYFELVHGQVKLGAGSRSWEQEPERSRLHRIGFQFRSRRAQEIIAKACWSVKGCV